MPPTFVCPSIEAGDLCGYSPDGSGAEWEPAFVTRVDPEILNGNIIALVLDLKYLNNSRAATGCRHVDDPALITKPHLRELNGVWKPIRFVERLEKLEDALEESVRALAVKIESVNQKLLAKYNKPKDE